MRSTTFRTGLRLLLASALGGAVACGGATRTPAPVDPKPASDAKPREPAPEVVDARPDVITGAAAQRDAELAEQAARYMDAFSNTAPVLTRDGKRVVFVSNRDGLPQLYVADAAKPDSPATRLVEWPQRVVAPFPLADGKSLLFASDVGADEHWSFYRVGLDGGEVTEVTPGERLNRDGFFVADGAPDTIYFSGRKMSEPASSIYAASIATPGEARKIYTDPKPMFLTSVSRDGKWAAAVQMPNGSENYVIVVSTATGEAKTVYPASGKVTVNDAEFSADGKRLFISTDGGAEQALVLAIDPRTGKELGRYVEKDPPTASIDDIIVAKKGGALALSLVAGDHAELRLLDAATLKPRAKVTMPVGAGAGVHFSDSGATLTAYWSTARSPADLYLIDAKRGKVAPLRSEPRPTLEGAPAITTTITTIDAFDGGKIPVNYYLPEGDAAQRRPVIVSYHGGPSSVSMVGWTPGRAFFLSLGYAWVEPNVRGSAGFGRAYEEADNGPKRLEAFRDVETSARWAAAQPWADPERMVVYGGSYGGYTVLIALARWPDLWRAGVNLFGVVDLNSFMATTSGLIREVLTLEFGDPDRDAEFLASISPITDVGKIIDPTFVYAGANDPRVPLSESDLIVKALRRRQVPTEYFVAADEGHSLARRPNQLALYSRVARFLETHLR